jgi:hypothetical protein
MDTRVRGYDGEVLDTRVRGYDGLDCGYDGQFIVLPEVRN